MDLDYFTRERKHIANFASACETGLLSAGFEVKRLISGENFVRMSVQRESATTVVDFATDYFENFEDSENGPILSDYELALNKVIALFDRAEARDAFDLWQISSSFDIEQLVEAAPMRNPGFTTELFVSALDSIARFDSATLPFTIEEWQSVNLWATELSNRLEVEPDKKDP